LEEKCIIINGFDSKGRFHLDELKCGGVHEKHAVEIWNLETISTFVLTLPVLNC
jgi:hypothetical protein